MLWVMVCISGGVSSGSRVLMLKLILDARVLLMISRPMGCVVFLGLGEFFFP